MLWKFEDNELLFTAAIPQNVLQSKTRDIRREYAKLILCIAQCVTIIAGTPGRGCER